MEDISQLLVPGRECGGCTVCCKTPTINVPELRKPPGVLCPHCVEGAGCQIYETRPTPCRNAYCGWRLMPQLDDAWRPDRSEVLLTLELDRSKPGHARFGIKVELFGSLATIHWPPLVDLITGAVQRNLPVYLSVPGPPGHFAGAALLNDGLASGVASGDLARINTELVNALEACVNHPKAAVNLDAD